MRRKDWEDTEEGRRKVAMGVMKIVAKECLTIYP